MTYDNPYHSDCCDSLLPGEASSPETREPLVHSPPGEEALLRLVNLWFTHRRERKRSRGWRLAESLTAGTTAVTITVHFAVAIASSTNEEE